MKKLVYLFLALILIASPLAFCGCSQKNEYWLATHQKLTEFVENESHSFLLEENNITYTNFVQTNFNKENDELNKVYEQTLKNLMFQLNNQYQTFKFKPFNEVKKKQLKNAFEELDQNIDNLTDATQTFISAKNTFETSVGQNDPNSSYSKQKHREFKRAFADYLVEVEKVNISFNKAYSLAYEKELPTTLEDESIIYYANYTAINILSVNYLNFAIKPFGGEVNLNADMSMLETATELRKQPANDFPSNLAYIDWKAYNDKFVQDDINFDLSLEKIDISKYIQNKTQYKLENPELIAYIECVENFISFSTPQIKQYVSKMFIKSA